MPAQLTTSFQAKMSSIILAIFVGLMIFSGGCNFAKSASKDGQPSSASIDTKTVVIPVDGLICVVCAARIKQTLQGMDGVTAVSVDLAHRSVRIQYNEGKASPDGLVTAINGLGYKAGLPIPADSAKSSG